MLQLETLVPALGAAGQGHIHNWWWVVLAVVVLAMVTPLAYLLGRNGGQPLRR